MVDGREMVNGWVMDGNGWLLIDGMVCFVSRARHGEWSRGQRRRNQSEMGSGLLRRLTSLLMVSTSSALSIQYYLLFQQHQPFVLWDCQTTVASRTRPESRHPAFVVLV